MQFTKDLSISTRTEVFIKEMQLWKHSEWYLAKNIGNIQNLKN